jgi:hypothetical protein
MKPPTKQVKWAHQVSYQEGKVSSSSLLPSGYSGLIKLPTEQVNYAQQAFNRLGNVGSLSLLPS